MGEAELDEYEDMKGEGPVGSEDVDGDGGTDEDDHISGRMQ